MRLAARPLTVRVDVVNLFDRLYELRLLNTAADPRDAVITAAGRLQGVLAGWVHQHGVWPWIVALVALVAAALVSAWHRRARR